VLIAQIPTGGGGTSAPGTFHHRWPANRWRNSFQQLTGGNLRTLGVRCVSANLGQSGNWFSRKPSKRPGVERASLISVGRPSRSFRIGDVLLFAPEIRVDSPVRQVYSHNAARAQTIFTEESTNISEMTVMTRKRLVCQSSGANRARPKRQ